MASDIDREHMLRAVALAETGRYTAHPNPLVGAVVIDVDGAVVGEGFHLAPGEGHAEALALAAAGDRARGGTLYVTLEPCAHHGRTPPCADAVVASGVARVVVAVGDPDTRVAGEGLTRIRSAGIEVEVGVGSVETAQQNRDYLHHRRTGLPWVVLKLAVSVDGLASADDGTSRWITGESARADVHRLRAEADAVMVGSGTFLADDPQLTCRLEDYRGPQPLRVVMDRRGRVDERDGWLALRGTLKEALEDLGRRGVVRLLVEGGPTLAAAFTADGVVDQYVSYIGPVALSGAPTIGAAPRLDLVDVARFGDDVRLTWEARR